MPVLTLTSSMLFATRLLKAASPKLDGFPLHVAELKQAPPPSTKIMRSSEVPRLTPMPVEEPSRQRAWVKGTHVHTPALRPVIGVVSDATSLVAESIVPES